MIRILGAADADGTHQFAQRAASKVAPHHFRQTPGGLTLSSIGLGTYLGRADPATDLLVESATQLCLRSGRVNVVDTAINYRGQRAERSVGRGIARAVSAGHVTRAGVFVATKAGYLAPDGESPVDADRWVEEQLVGRGVISPADIVEGCHCMSPSYLQDQIDRSRSNLGLETLDLLYLHNAPDTQMPSVGRPEFLRRLKLAFRALEAARSSGHLVAYGLATWDSLRAPVGDSTFLSLEEAVGVARTAGGPSHGFRFVQFPFNTVMPEAALSLNQPVRGRPLSLLDAAEELGVECFTSIPLAQGQLARSGPLSAGLSRAQTAIQFARSTPGVLAPLVGQKSAAHLSEDLAVAEVEPWPPGTFDRSLTDWGLGSRHPRS